MPILVLMPHSRCNCRCVMCDIWKANESRRELTAGEFEPHLESMRRLGVRQVMLSGGEPLMHSNLWEFCRLLKTVGVRITLLSTGILLEREATQIAEFCAEVIVSLDGASKAHDAIRRIPGAYEALARGVRALRAAGPDLRVTGRCVIQRGNYVELPQIVEAARELGLEQISFLPADVSSTAFNRPSGWPQTRVSEIALDTREIQDLRSIIEKLIEDRAADFRSGFIAESPDKLRRLPAYYAACGGEGEFPANRCNAPWVSAVVEADGAVRPCFFHEPFGNVHRQSLEAILNGPDAVAFRKSLDVSRDAVCRRCVCTLHLDTAAI